MVKFIGINDQAKSELLVSYAIIINSVNWDWFILLVAKTGMRFSEALALTPEDFDFSKQVVLINKTWDYKGQGGFLPTKNKSSVRKVQLDWKTVMQFSQLVKDLPSDEPIFVKSNDKIYNSTVNGVLFRLCKKADIPTISIHGLRHPYVKPTTKKFITFFEAFRAAI